MKFALDFDIDVGDQVLDSAAFLAQAATPSLPDFGDVTGRIAVHVDGGDVCGGYSDPLVRLVDQWLRKLPWIIGGDTETVALRNAERCFAFVPAAESVEISFFDGTEVEVEEYVLEPCTVRMETLVSESIALAERLIAALARVDAAAAAAQEDCRDLGVSLAEAKRVWHEHQLHLRR